MSRHPSARRLFAAERLIGWAETWTMEARDLDEQSGIVLENAASMVDADPAKDHERAYGHALHELAKMRRFHAEVITGVAESRAADLGFVSAETAVITALWAGGLLFATACALVGLG